jgi:hypothetical protein
MMKLYTEEHVIKMIEKSRETGLTAEFLILTTPPIELPSDEEIWDRADEIWGRADSEQSDVRHLAFMQGAKWMRNKIQGGKK